MRCMSKIAVLAGLALLSCVATAGAQQAEPKAKKAVAAKAKASSTTKVCNYRFPDGERRTWTCRKEEPCCAWDAIKYVKCGSTITNCL